MIGGGCVLAPPRIGTAGGSIYGKDSTTEFLIRPYDKGNAWVATIATNATNATVEDTPSLNRNRQLGRTAGGSAFYGYNTPCTFTPLRPCVKSFSPFPFLLSLNVTFANTNLVKIVL